MTEVLSTRFPTSLWLYGVHIQSQPCFFSQDNVLSVFLYVKKRLDQKGKQVACYYDKSFAAFPSVSSRECYRHIICFVTKLPAFSLMGLCIRCKITWGLDFVLLQQQLGIFPCGVALYFERESFCFLQTAGTIHAQTSRVFS